MKIVIQRVKFAEVMVENRCVSRIEKGLFLLVGFSNKDKEVRNSPVWNKIVKKIPDLRIFPDEQVDLI